MKSSLFFFFLIAVAAPALADEGMWLFDHFPREAVKQKYGVDVSAEFLDRLRLASVRIGGSTGAFVSSSGLLVTNQHVGRRVPRGAELQFSRLLERRLAGKCGSGREALSRS